MNKRLLVVLGIILVAAIGALVYARRLQVAPMQPSLPARAPVASATGPSFPKSISQIQPAYRIEMSEQVFPSFLPTISYEQPFLIKQQALTIANALGFRDPPTEIRGNRGVLYSWQQNGETVTVGGVPIEISYTSFRSSSAVISARANDVDSVVDQFRQRTKLIMPGVSLLKTSTVFYEPTREGAKETANTSVATRQRSSYNYLTDGYPIYTRYIGVPALSAQTNGDGQLEQLTAYWYPEIQKSTHITPVVDYKEATRRLLSSEGVLLAYSPKNPPLSDIPQKLSIQTTSIFRAELAYYYTPDNTMLSPVFVFYGQGNDVKTGASVDTVTVVSALPSLVPTP